MALGLEIIGPHRTYVNVKFKHDVIITKEAKISLKALDKKFCHEKFQRACLARDFFTH
jgi:hypothetical protein